MKHSEFAVHKLFVYQGREYICTDIGKRTIVAVLWSDVREDWWLASPPYPGAMTEAVFDENRQFGCEPVHKPATPPPAQTPKMPSGNKTVPSPVPKPADPQAAQFPPLSLVVLATAFCVLGIGSLLYCIASTLHARDFLAHAVRTNAVVTSVTDSTDAKQHHRYTPTFEFADNATGKNWINTSNQTEDTPRRVGESVAILYDPQIPRRRGLIRSRWLGVRRWRPAWALC